MKAYINRDYEKDQFVIRWLNGLSPKTKFNYAKEFVDWLNFIDMTPTEQIKKRMQNLTSLDLMERTFFENKWRAYKQLLESKETLRDATIHGRLRTVASFFSRNDLTLNLHKGDWDSTQKQEVIMKFKLDLDNVKRMYGHANLNEKCLLLILAQSGFSEVDISELKIEDIKDLYEMPQAEHYVIEKPREKTNSIQATCLSYEFLHDLRDLLAERGNPKEGFIFTSQTKEKGIANIGIRRINESMKALAEKTFGTEKAKEFHTKALRSFYNSALLRAKIQPQEVKDLMMGHLRIGARANYSYDSETIKEAYLSAFEYLSINGIQSREDLANLKENMNKLIGSQQVQIETQKKELSELKKSIDGIYHILQTYPTELKHTLINKEKGKIEEYTETVNNPKEEKESIKKFQQKIKDISK